MPVTARLSRLLYDRLGEAVTNELVDWLNQVDSAYKSDLREMNELNCARFDAKLDQTRTELRGEIGRLRSEFQVAHARIEIRLESSLREQTRFFFLAWAAQLAAILGLWFR